VSESGKTSLLIKIDRLADIEELECLKTQPGVGEHFLCFMTCSHGHNAKELASPQLDEGLLIEYSCGCLELGDWTGSMQGECYPSNVYRKLGLYVVKTV
jgi:hypothetical protein